MLTIREVVTQVREAGFDVEEGEVKGFVRQRWVLAQEQESTLYFDEADTARVRLIVELRQDLGVNDEAVPVILKLLDQLYGLREVLNEVRAAVASLPPELRTEFEACLAKVHRE